MKPEEALACWRAVRREVIASALYVKQVWVGSGDTSHATTTAETAVKVADALLEQLDKKRPPPPPITPTP